MHHQTLIFYYAALLIALITTVTGEQHIIRLKLGETYDITNDKYPQTSSNIDEMWMFGTSHGRAIKLECDDIRINSKTCDDGKLSVSAGNSPEAICDTRNSYTVTSLFESLYVELNLKASDGAIKCKVTAVSSPTGPEIQQKDIHVKTYDVNNDISHPNLERMKVYEYVVTAEPDSELIATCSLAHSGSQAKDPCDGLALLLKSGGSEEKYCESENRIVFHSGDDILKITLKTGLMVGTGYMFCSIRGVFAGQYSKYKEIASEEVDSSEHGLTSKKGQKSTTCNCGWANKQVKRVIYGHDTDEHEYPWSVSLQYLSGFHFCGGSIISEYHILTCAHCIHTEPNEIRVVMGTNNKNDDRNVNRVKEIIRHAYDRPTSQNDIAILVLEKKIEFNQFIGPVCLPSKELKIDHQYVTAMGWGNLADEEYEIKDPTIQKETKLRAVDLYSCTIDWNFKWDPRTSKVMCTWSNHTDICLGDSGGPIVWLDPETNRYTLVGMPTVCDGCRLTIPTVHTSVYHFYDWIQSKIAGSSQPEGKTCTRID